MTWIGRRSRSVCSLSRKAFCRFRLSAYFLAVCFWGLLWQATVVISAAEPPDLLRLRDALCAKESRTAPTPESVVNRNQETGQWDAGVCQISVSRLIDLGYLSTLRKPSTRNPKWIFDREGSRAIALEIIAVDFMEIERKGQRPTAACLAVKFHWGKSAKCTKARLAHPYTQDVMAMMQAVAVARRSGG